jgi:adenylylsulfate kinase
METHGRTILKSLTWRVGGLLLTVLTAWLITRKVEVAASIGLLDTLLKVFAYYVHERLWLKVRFGQTKPTDYQI